MQQNTVKNDGMFPRFPAGEKSVGKQWLNKKSGGNTSEPRMDQGCDPDDKSYKQPSLDEIWEWLGDPDAV